MVETGQVHYTAAMKRIVLHQKEGTIQDGRGAAWILIGSAFLLVLFSVAVFWQIDPWKENLTGLGWKRGQLLLMAGWTTLACLEGGLLTWMVLFGYGAARPAKICLLSWVLLLSGCLIPWSEQGLFGDLHSLLCTAGILIWCLNWIWIFQGWQFDRKLKKTAGALLMAAAGSAALIAFSSGISLVSEMAFVFSSLLILAVDAFRQRKSRSGRA